MKIWTNAGLPQDALNRLKSETIAHELAFSVEQVFALGAQKAAEGLDEAEVVYGQPSVEQLLADKRLKMVQVSSAGYTRFDTPAFKAEMIARGVAFCNSSTVFADPCAQHVVSFMLAGARQLCTELSHDGHDRWNFEKLRPAAQILTGQTALIVGFGAIGNRLVELLTPYRMNLIGFRRFVRGDEKIECHETQELERFLPGADHVVNLLPANPQSDGFFGESRFAAMRRGARFYNIGRGTTVDQSALIAALRSGHLAQAFLDVTDPEPLPDDHPLWTTPHCTITPHIGGGFIGEEMVSVNHFLENLRRFEAGLPLADRVF